MSPRIAIPVPTSTNVEYNAKSWPQYAEAVREAGGEPVEIRLDLSPREIADLINTCQGVLLPGSPADVNPQKFGHEAAPETSPADPARENVDELLIQDAHNLYKPLLGICFGTQSLNVWRGGTLVQHLAPMPVNHPAGKTVAVAHNALVAPQSTLGEIVADAKAADGAPEAVEADAFLSLPINSSHHQAIGIPGDGLRVVARCPQDGVIEAVEGGQDPHRPESHFVLGVQWHPERSRGISAASRAIFTRLVQEAAGWKPREIKTSVVE
ncbi:MAG: gamma-glutamyl-gamma-aminobutyrate hydrolase family protein [Edaphobacter sp.]|uniref:gamma-glutamyl-gamma-aminobutyrate hydrolase family protein n=1 Tax=Edaphobacter sp. TaxID=1934404 RepID=UPI0023946D9C|nr:gamma-glutamyl-gamma-aminobutyrate hydrolase family protein [Edaphobacter sp.]MDE1175854.1 gamma-glutamyl-gamma-aminobutyrate hydrolase family protein [Edaphobacter sp.]